MAVHPDPLDAQSVVYSFGVGRDVGWDREMIDRFGMTIHGFDPSPGSIEWAERAALPTGFTFHPFGLGTDDGTMKLYPPKKASTVHFSVVNRGRSPEDAAVDVPVRSLASIGAMLGHHHIDVLKMDVEGAEYDLMPSILHSGIAIRQITLEVHHNYASIPFSKTCDLVAMLRSAGFRIFDVSDRGQELSLIHESCLHVDVEARA